MADNQTELHQALPGRNVRWNYDSTAGSDSNVGDFDEVLRVAALLDGFGRPWFVAGGWAIDLFLGRVTRRHKDMEIVILRPDQHALRKHLTGWEFKKVKRVSGGENGTVEAWPEDEWLQLPTHEIHADKPGADLPTLEILLNESSGEDWKFRRNPEIVRPLGLVGMSTPAGVPFLAPEIVLLYKAKNPGANDQSDFENARRLMKREPRAWLKQALEICHPGHPWLSDL
jgi:hypothetical protein